MCIRDRYVIVTDDACQCYNNWNQLFTAESLERELREAGFETVTFFDDVCGRLSLIHILQAAKPEPSYTSGTSVAGFGTAMDRHLKSVEEKGSQAAPAALTQEKVVFGTFRDIFKNLGVAMVEDSLNIRKEPKNDAEIVGKMESHAGCSVLGMEHGWYKIRSGQVTGYVSGKYLAVGQAARASAYCDMKLMLRVNTDTLRRCV